MIRIYIMPTETVVVDGKPYRGPKYANWRFNRTAERLNGRCNVYIRGKEACFLVADVTDTQHTTLIANADVFVVPENMDETINNGSRLNLARTALEACGLDTTNLKVGDGFRTILRQLSGLEEVVKGGAIKLGALDL